MRRILSRRDVHRQEVRRMVSLAQAPRLRPLRQWAEDELFLTSGPYAGRRFKCSRQPVAGHIFDAIDSGRWNRIAVCGPNQSGKSMAALVAPLLFNICEKRESVVLFAPTMDIAADKVLTDILPVLQKSRYADLLPTRGPGSQSGFAPLILFRNGARLKSMSAKGSDSSKAAFSGRVLFITEADGCDDVRESSDESDPISQVEARLLSHGLNTLTVIESTVTTASGRITCEYESGTRSQIVLQCVHCERWTAPERENLVGWDVAKDELEAEEKARWSCPECGGLWTPAQREDAVRQSRVVHRGQTIAADGSVVGEVPRTRTASIRYSAVHNLFAPEKLLGNREFRAAREIDRSNAEKRLGQQTYAVPWAGETESTDLSPEAVASRVNNLPWRVIPDTAETLVVQIDLHDRWHYWTALATSPNSVRDIPDYGLWINPSVELNGVTGAISLGLEQLANNLESIKWTRAGGASIEVDCFVVDAGYQTDVSLEFVTQRNAAAKAEGRPVRWILSKGRGNDYRAQKATPDILTGDHWYASRQPAKPQSGGKDWWLVIPETNAWLHHVHSGFAGLSFQADGMRRHGSISIYGDDTAAHLKIIDKTVARSAFALQILGWKWQPVTTKKRGTQMEFVNQYAQDHWLDTLYGACVADAVVRKWFPRFRVVPPPVPTPQRPEFSEQQKRLMAGIAAQAERIGRIQNY